MAHIPDGVLSLPVLAGGWTLAAGALALGLRRLDEETLPRTGVLAALFFTVSLVALPVGPSSVHALLATLMALLIGIRAVPAIFAGLLLQTLFFGFGGLTTLGLNTVTIALPGVAVAALIRPGLRRAGPARAGVVAGIGAAVAVALTGAGVALALALSASEFVPAARILVATYLPLMAGEGLLTGLVVAFLKRVRPESFAEAEA